MGWVALVAMGCAPPDVPQPPPLEDPAPPVAVPAEPSPTPVPAEPPEPAPPAVTLLEGAWVTTEGGSEDPPALRYDRLRAREGSEPVLRAVIDRTGELHTCYRQLLAEHPEALGQVIINLDPPPEPMEPVDIKVQSSGTHKPPEWGLGLPGMDDCVRAVVIEALEPFADWRRGEALGPYVTLAYQLRPRRSDLRLRAVEMGPDEELRTLPDGSCEIVRRRTSPCPRHKRCPSETTRPGLCTSSRADGD